MEFIDLILGNELGQLPEMDDEQRYPPTVIGERTLTLPTQNNLILQLGEYRSKFGYGINRHL